VALKKINYAKDQVKKEGLETLNPIAGGINKRKNRIKKYVRCQSRTVTKGMRGQTLLHGKLLHFVIHSTLWERNALRGEGGVPTREKTRLN